MKPFGTAVSQRNTLSTDKTKLDYGSIREDDSRPELVVKHPYFLLVSRCESLETIVQR